MLMGFFVETCSLCDVPTGGPSVASFFLALGFMIIRPSPMRKDTKKIVASIRNMLFVYSPYFSECRFAKYSTISVIGIAVFLRFPLP